MRKSIFKSVFPFAVGLLFGGTLASFTFNKKLDSLSVDHSKNIELLRKNYTAAYVAGHNDGARVITFLVDTDTITAEKYSEHLSVDSLSFSKIWIGEKH